MTALFTVTILGLREGTKAFGGMLAGMNDVTTLMLVYGVVGVIAMGIAIVHCPLLWRFSPFSV